MSIASAPAPQRVLAVDGGSPVASVAAGRRGEVVARAESRRAHASDDLLSLISTVLEEAGWTPGDLDGLVALRGPGSFTGLRVGLATVLGLHQALAIPATGVSSLAAMALQAAPRRGSVVAAADALRGEWLAQPFALDGDVSPQPLAEPVRIVAGDLAGLARDAAGEAAERRKPLPSADSAAPMIVGFGIAALEGAAGWPGGVELREAAPLAPVAIHLAAHPGSRWDPDLLTRPIYSRPPAARPAAR